MTEATQTMHMYAHSHELVWFLYFILFSTPLLLLLAVLFQKSQASKGGTLDKASAALGGSMPVLVFSGVMLFGSSNMAVSALAVACLFSGAIALVLGFWSVFTTAAVGPGPAPGEVWTPFLRLAVPHPLPGQRRPSSG